MVLQCNNSGTGTDTRIMIGEGNAAATNTFSGDVVVNNVSTSTDGFVRFNLRGTTTFSGNVFVNSTLGTGLNNGVAFGWPGYSGTASIASDKTITIGSTDCWNFVVSDFTHVHPHSLIFQNGYNLF
jgi:hypothetical protein